MKWLTVFAITLTALFAVGCTIEVKPLKDKKPVRHISHAKAKQPRPSPTPDLSRLAPVLREPLENSDGAR
jgi:hypothetical protein